MLKKIINRYLSLAIFFSAASLCAQETAKTTDQNPSLIKILGSGGPIMYFLAFLSFIALCLVFYYLLSLRVKAIAPPIFVQQAEQAIAQKDFQMLAKICKENDSPAAKIISAGTEIYIRSKNNYVMIRDAVEDEGARQANKLWHKIQPLQDIAVVAPMIGLLGTVIGMIQAFVSLTGEIATPRPTAIASGVSTALITTAAGLIIGIIAMILYSFFRSKINKLLTVLENSCNKVTVEMMVTEKEEGVPF